MINTFRFRKRDVGIFTISNASSLNHYSCFWSQQLKIKSRTMKSLKQMYSLHFTTEKYAKDARKKSERYRSDQFLVALSMESIFTKNGMDILIISIQQNPTNIFKHMQRDCNGFKSTKGIQSTPSITKYLPFNHRGILINIFQNRKLTFESVSIQLKKSYPPQEPACHPPTHG